MVTYFVFSCTRPNSQICIFFSSPQPFGKLNQSWKDVLGETLAFWWVFNLRFNGCKWRRRSNLATYISALPAKSSSFQTFWTSCKRRCSEFETLQKLQKHPTFLVRGSFYWKPAGLELKVSFFSTEPEEDLAGNFKEQAHGRGIQDACNEGQFWKDNGAGHKLLMLTHGCHFKELFCWKCNTLWPQNDFTLSLECVASFGTKQVR